MLGVENMTGLPAGLHKLRLAAAYDARFRHLSLELQWTWAFLGILDPGGPGAAWCLHVRGPAAVNCIASRGDLHWALQRKMAPSTCMNRCLGNRPPSMSWLAWLALALLPARGSLARLALALRPGGACLILPGPLGLARARAGLARPGGPVAQLPPRGKPQDANAMANSIILKKLYHFLINSLKLLSLPLRLRPGVCLLAEAGPPGHGAGPGRAARAKPSGRAGPYRLGQPRPAKHGQQRQGGRANRARTGQGSITGGWVLGALRDSQSLPHTASGAWIFMFGVHTQR